MTEWVRYTKALLASGNRTATTDSDEQYTAMPAKGVVFYIDATTIAGGETITPVLQAKDPISGSWGNYVNFTAISAASQNFKVAYPAAVNGGASGFEGKNVPLPHTWRLRVTHSASGTHAYSVAYGYLF